MMTGPFDAREPLAVWLGRMAGAGAPAAAHAPWPRRDLSRAGWTALEQKLAREPWEALAIWADPPRVLCLLRDPGDGQMTVVATACPGGGFLSLAQARPGLARMERAIRDLHGLIPEDAPDDRPWLDHGAWPDSRDAAKEPYPMLPVDSEEVLHQIPVGPIHAGIIEPGHFRFHCNGETVVRMEERMGYMHRGLEALAVGRPPAEAAKLAARLSGDSTVAVAVAYARAVEAAWDLAAPPRAQLLRGLAQELERIANHFGDIGAIINDAAFPLLHMECQKRREEIARLARDFTGHRLMMDYVVPGGVARDLTPAAARQIREKARDLEQKLLRLVRIYQHKPSLLDRTVTTGIVKPEWAIRFAAGGYVGRASGRGFDARKSPGYAPYDDLDFDVPTRTGGDVHARVEVRALEISQSLRLIRQILQQLDHCEGERIAVGPLPGAGANREGAALSEGFRGEYLAWVRLDGDGRIARLALRDPSWLQWPLLETALDGNIVADFPLCNKSFNGSYAGVDG